MNVSAIIALIVALVVVGGGAWYLSSKSPAGPGAAMEETEEGEGMMEGSGVLGNLLGFSAPVMCDVSTVNDVSASFGTVYAAGGKMRADFTSAVTPTGAADVESHMILADGYIYTWGNAMPQGLKMQQPEEGTLPDGESESSGIDTSAAVDYSCAPWVPNEGMFTPPSDVTFVDPSAMMEGLLPEGMMMQEVPY